jgi:hypothetical protein
MKGEKMSEKKRIEMLADANKKLFSKLTKGQEQFFEDILNRTGYLGLYVGEMIDRFKFSKKVFLKKYVLNKFNIERLRKDITRDCHTIILLFEKNSKSDLRVDDVNLVVKQFEDKFARDYRWIFRQLIDKDINHDMLFVVGLS